MIRLVQVAKRARSAIMPVAGTVVEVATALRFASAVRDMKHMQVALPPPLSLGVLGLAADVPSMERRDDDLEAVQEGEDDEETTRLDAPKETWKESIWFAVPKRKVRLVAAGVEDARAAGPTDAGWQLCGARQAGW